MRLDRLINEVDLFERPPDARKVEVTKITDIVADVEPGTLFFCIKGDKVDGHSFAGEAVNRGAVALVVERDLDENVIQCRVTNTRASMAPIASAFYDHPSRRLRMAGITGTNGKTTTAHLLHHILTLHRWRVELIGTLTGAFTTPPAIQLQRQLAEFRDRDCNSVVMEVSSSALVQNRVDTIQFDVGIFTNLSQDHLDYHGTMEKYFVAKSILFEPGRVETAVINVDDEYGRRLVDRLAVPLEPFSLSHAHDLNVGASGSDFVWHDQQIHLPLMGEFNVYNALAAATAARAMGVSLETIKDGLGNVDQIPGRMELIRRRQPFGVVVDFAHTPDGLQNVLQVARHSTGTGGRVLVVFGCGGDRDKGKRPLMGKIAEELSDEIVLTTDNSRSEDPAEIVNEIMSGMTDSKRAHVYLDRRKAIGEAVAHANPGDVVVIAGKGHEAFQEVGGVKTRFDDRFVATAAVDEWVARQGSAKEGSAGDRS